MWCDAPRRIHDAERRATLRNNTHGVKVMIELASEITAHLGDGTAAFDRIFGLTGKVFRHVEGRQTLRVEIGGQAYFLKRHHGYGWKSILRTLSSGHWPVLSARNEVDAVRCLESAGISTVEVVGFGERGRNPATRESFILMRELTGCQDLERLCATWSRQPPTSTFRRALIASIAETTRKMHAAGLNHRDYYLCHLWLKCETEVSEPLHMHVIDLHRAMRHRRVPLFWLIKDLAGVLFSAWDCGLTKSDCLRFVSNYRGCSARESFSNERWMWRTVIWRANRLYWKTHRRAVPLTLTIPKVSRRSNCHDTAATQCPSPTNCARRAA